MKRLTTWLILSAILIAVWEVLARLIPEGWGLAPINIICLLASVGIGAFGYLPSFRRWMRGSLAWCSAIVLWLVLFVGIRSIL